MDCMYGYVDGKIGAVFAGYGRQVARHAWKVVIITVAVNIALAVGMLRLKENTDVEDNYLPFGTRARSDRDRVHELFPDLSGYNYNTLQFEVLGSYAGVYLKSKSGNLLTVTTLADVQRLDNYIKATIAISDTGDNITLTDICAIAASKCVVNGELFVSAEFLSAVADANVTYPAFVTPHGVTYYASDVAGVTTGAQGSVLTGMEYISILYILRTDDDRYRDLCDAWVHAVQERMETFSSEYFEVVYGHYLSLEEELDKNVSGDISLFAVTIALMITYACMATMTARWDNVGQRVILGFTGVLAAGLSIPASFGLCSLFGLEFVAIVGLMPFLVIGIGIDDMFILLSGLAGAQGRPTVEDKIAETLRTSGVGITITSFTDLLAFMAGASSKFLAVKNFCIFTGTAVILCYLNNITLFAASCAINERRAHDGRHYATCRPVKSKAEYMSEGKSKRHVFCCAGSRPTSRQESESYLDKLPRWLIPKIVLKLPAKIIICLLFAGYLAASIYGSANLKQGVEFKQLIPYESYFYRYVTWLDDVFPKEFPVAFYIDGAYNYSDAAIQTNVDELIASVQGDGYFKDDYKVSWLDTYKKSTYYSDTLESSFIAGLRAFYNDTMYRRFENDILIDDTTNTIIASRVYALTVTMANSQVNGKMMIRSREIADAASLNCFAYHPDFVGFEQYVAVLGQTLQTVGIAVVAVFLITSIFMPHPLLVLYVTIVVAMIMCGVIGFLLYLDLTLSSITMIHIIMCIGFSVDFAAHICHGFMSSQGSNRNERVQGAIDKTGAPIFHGAMSSFLGVIILMSAKSYIFRTFSKVMSLVLAFGLAHSLFLLPVVLSWIGPRSSATVPDTDTDKGVSNPAMEMDESGNTKGANVVPAVHGINNKTDSCDEKHDLPFYSQASTILPPIKGNQTVNVNSEETVNYKL